MIQRIQTLFLLAGCVLFASNYFLGDVWSGPAAVESSWFTPVTLGLYSLAVIGGVFSIFLYKNQIRQKKAIMWVSITSFVGFVVLAMGLLTGAAMPFVSEAVVTTQTWMALGTPVVGLGCFLFARRGVEKDLKLLRSVDRLR